MSLNEKLPQTSAATEKSAVSSTPPKTEEAVSDQKTIENERSKKLVEAKELYSNGSRNFLVKNYVEAADELSQVCALYAELYGDLADELGMPYLLYAKSLIALSLDENKVIDVPDEAADDDDDDEDEDVDDNDDDDDDDGNDENGEGEVEVKEKRDKKATKTESEAISSNSNANKVMNGKENNEKLATIKETGEKTDEADSTADETVKRQKTNRAKIAPAVKEGEDALVTSTNNEKLVATSGENNTSSTSKPGSSRSAKLNAFVVKDDEKPSTSNGIVHDEQEDVADEEENEAASNLQLAWEILETAANIFSRQGASGLPNLAEVQTELANIEFENCILDAARADYEKALKIYFSLESQNYRRAMAEIHYKIGLTFLMQQLNKEGAASLKEACQLIQGEIDEIKLKDNISEKEKNTIQDMEETKQEIEAKIAEIEEMQAQQIAEVRAALDSYIKPIMANSASNNDAGPSTSSASSSSSAASKPKPNDISHLIKRKKPEDKSSEAEAASPAKRAAH